MKIESAFLTVIVDIFDTHTPETMGLRYELAALAAAVCAAQVGVFFLYAATSCQLPRASAAADELRVLVVSDIHILGKRRRSWLERAWIDWQV